MKALSIRAPYCWAILHLGKDIENRDWWTGFRGTVWLHAGKWFDPEEVKDDYQLSVMPMWKAGRPGIAMPPGPTLRELQAAGGCLVGKVDIVGCVKDSDSPWFAGKYGFVLANPVALAAPILFKGALRLFNVPDDIEVSQ